MKIAFVGGGNMANAIIGGLLAAGRKPAEIVVVEIDPQARARMAMTYGVGVQEAIGPELDAADVVLVAVKPQGMRQVAQALAARAPGALFVSIAAGIRIADMARWLGGRDRIVRAMPNTPALVHAGITGLHAGPGADDADRATAEELMRAVGATLWFEDEGALDAVTAVSGSGPAYVLYAIEALEEAGRELGLGDAASRSLALWTFVGAAKLAIERQEDPRVLRAQVTSKGGTTERALGVMEERGVKRHFIEAVKAAAERSRELGDALGKD
jgi:pyrroline-5-carboxylate reductase